MSKLMIKHPPSGSRWSICTSLHLEKAETVVGFISAAKNNTPGIM
jgi:hypothetical protein